MCPRCIHRAPNSIKQLDALCRFGVFELQTPQSNPTSWTLSPTPAAAVYLFTCADELPNAVGRTRFSPSTVKCIDMKCTIKQHADCSALYHAQLFYFVAFVSDSHSVLDVLQNVKATYCNCSHGGRIDIFMDFRRW